MWISKDRYNEFIKYEVFYLTNKRRVFDCNMCEKIDRNNYQIIADLKIENEKLKEELNKYKQKYADEF